MRKYKRKRSVLTIILVIMICSITVVCVEQISK